MSKPKLIIGDIALTKSDKIIIIIGGEKEGDTWRYCYQERLNRDDNADNYIREYEVQSVYRSDEWIDV